MALTFHALAQRLHLRIIAADRPAIGKSDRLPGRQVAQSTADLLQVLEQLGVQKKFSVLAMSAGSMYALAAAVSPALRNRIVGKVGCKAGGSSLPGMSRLSGATPAPACCAVTLGAVMHCRYLFTMTYPTLLCQHCEQPDHCSAFLPPTMLLLLLLLLLLLALPLPPHNLR